MHNLPRPLLGRGVRICKEISYNSFRNYALYIVHYELNKFHITNCAVAFQATESFCLHCNLMKTTPNRKADYTVIKVVL